MAGTGPEDQARGDAHQELPGALPTLSEPLSLCNMSLSCLLDRLLLEVPSGAWAEGAQSILGPRPSKE